jgi:exonuclease III
MRLVVWNIRSGTDRKWAALTSMKPDVAVLCEAAQRPKSLAAPALGEPDLYWEWEGTNPNKGLAIASWGSPMRRLDTTKSIGRWSIAAKIGKVTVVGVWSCPLTSGAYAGEVGRALEAFADPLASSDQCVVAGDFNVSGRHPSFDALRRRFEALGMVSAYHQATDDPFGWESTMTWHARHDAERSYHIDFVFVSTAFARSITNVEVRSPELMIATGLSDHSPIIVDFDETPSC